MNPLVIVAIVVVVAIAGWLIWQRQRTEHLHARYGAEYDRTVSELGRRKAESELVHRKKRVEQLNVRPLTADQRSRFTQQWRDVQGRFVDDPQGAVTAGDHLVEEVMSARGYPIADFDQRVADLSVHHSRVVENYRAARVVARRHRRGEATTEDLRQAMVYYRELFVDLLEESAPPDARVTERVVDRRVVREDAAELAGHTDSIIAGDEHQPPNDTEVRG